MSVTVQQIVDQVSYDLLEPSVNGPGLSKGVVTNQEVLDYLGEILMDFLSATGMVWGVFTQMLQAGVSQYLVPDRMSEVYSVLQNTNVVDKDSLFSTYLVGQWQRNPGKIRAYHEDGLPIKTIETIPAPAFNGVPFTPTVGPPPPFGNYDDFQPGNGNLTFVGSLLASQETWTIDQTLDTIPDTFTPYLVFGILSMVFSKDGEARDQQRAAYCRTRYEEGILLGRSILQEYIWDSPTGEE